MTLLTVVCREEDGVLLCGSHRIHIHIHIHMYLKVNRLRQHCKGSKNGQVATFSLSTDVRRLAQKATDTNPRFNSPKITFQKGHFKIFKTALASPHTHTVGAPPPFFAQYPSKSAFAGNYLSVCPFHGPHLGHATHQTMPACHFCHPDG